MVLNRYDIHQGDLVHHKHMRYVFEVTRKRGDFIWLRVYGMCSPPKSWKLPLRLFDELGFTKAGEQLPNGV